MPLFLEVGVRGIREKKNPKIRKIKRGQKKKERLDPSFKKYNTGDQEISYKVNGKNRQGSRQCLDETLFEYNGPKQRKEDTTCLR